MIKCGVLGIGNAGCQVAADAVKDGFKAIAINSSDSDINTIKGRGIPSLLIGNGDGSGKDRNESKNALKAGVMNLIKHSKLDEFMSDLDAVFVVASTGGGTGSGIGPVFTTLLEQKFPNTKPILVAIMPTYQESLAAQDNNIQFFKEVVNSLSANATYMVYDNSKFSGMATNLVLEEVNRDIIEDMIVIRGDYQSETKYDSIDRKESKILSSTPGRLSVIKLRDIQESALDTVKIDDLLLESLNKSATAEIDRDGYIKTMGVISNLKPSIVSKFDPVLSKFTENVGKPIEIFQHVGINESKEDENQVFVILGGLSEPSTRIMKSVERSNEIIEAHKSLEAKSNIYDAVDLDEISSLRRSSRDTKDSVDMTDQDVEDLFGRFI